MARELSHSIGEFDRRPPFQMAADARGIRGDVTDIATEKLAAQVLQVVQTEGPVPRSEVVRRLAEGAGVKRMGSRIGEAFEKAIHEAVTHHGVESRGDFLWPTGVTEAPLRDRSELPAAARKVEFVSPEEWARAVAILIACSLGATPDELAPAVAKVLGSPRATEALTAAVHAAIRSLLEQGVIQQQGETLMATSARTVMPAAGVKSQPPQII